MPWKKYLHKYINSDIKNKASTLRYGKLSFSVSKASHLTKLLKPVPGSDQALDLSDGYPNGLAKQTRSIVRRRKVGATSSEDD